MRATLESRMLATYGADKLVRYDASVVNQMEISQECKDFLINVGLPRWDGRDMIFGRPFNNLLTIQSIREDELLPLRARGYGFPQEFKHYRVIGLEEQEFLQYRVIGLEALGVIRTQGQTIDSILAFICLDEKEGGSIVRVTFRGAYSEIEFLNSSVLHFAEFLVMFAQTSQRSKDALARKAGVELTKAQKDALYRRVGRKIVRELRVIDPAACEPNGAWRGVLSDYWWYT